MIDKPKRTRVGGVDSWSKSPTAALFKGFSVYAQDLDALDAYAKRHGLANRSEALRQMIRLAAQVCSGKRVRMHSAQHQAEPPA